MLTDRSGSVTPLVTKFLSFVISYHLGSLFARVAMDDFILIMLRKEYYMLRIRSSEEIMRVQLEEGIGN